LRTWARSETRHQRSGIVAFPHVRVFVAGFFPFMKRGTADDVRSGMTMLRTTESTTRSAAAERMRLHRERRRLGLRCLMIELRETEIDALVRRGLLKWETRNDSGLPRTRHVH